MSQVTLCLEGGYKGAYAEEIHRMSQLCLQTNSHRSDTISSLHYFQLPVGEQRAFEPWVFETRCTIQ